MRKVELSLVICTKNEAHFLKKCVESVPFAGEIIVVDTQSTDGTAELARSLGAKVIVRGDPGVRDQKQFALEQATKEWVLALDPDEYLTPESQAEMEKLLSGSPAKTGYSVPRLHFFMGRLIRHGKGIDHPLRLVRRAAARYSNDIPHEYILVDGPVDGLKNPMIHMSSISINRRLEKIRNETDLELTKKLQRPPTFKEIFLNPIIYFTSFIVKQGGWRDGIPGMILIGLFSFQIFIMHAKFYEAHLAAKSKEI